MEIIILFTAALWSLPVISEVCSNPANENAGEFVEIYNNSLETIDMAGYTITDGDALDDIQSWTTSFPETNVTTGTTLIPAGGFAILLEDDYSDDPWLTFPDGTVILTTGDHSICNGLAASSDPLTLYNPSGSSQSDVVSTFGTPVQSDDWHDCDDDALDSIPFKTGEELSIGRYPMDGIDCEKTWFAGVPTPGKSTEAPPDTFFITIDSLFMDNMDPLPGSTVQFSAVVSCHGNTSPDSGMVVLFVDTDGDSIPQLSEILYSYPASNLIPGKTETLDISFTAPDKGWYPAVCSAPGVSSRIHFSTGGGINPIITEVMSNPLNEDQEEFIEILYAGPGVFPLVGCCFTDGDAVDQIISFRGSHYIKTGQAALILDPEYQGTMNIPAGVPLFRPINTTIGNGLTADDPVLLYFHGEPSLATLLSTAGTPLLYDDPLLCDDDGLDSIPFNPGNGHSMERVSPTGPDAEFNWMISPPGGTPGVAVEGQKKIDLSTDTIFIDNTIQAVFSNCGTVDTEGLCTIFYDLNGDLSPTIGETIHQQTLRLAPGCTDTLFIPFSEPDSGLFVVGATIHTPEDTIVLNNTRHCMFIPAKPAWPVITEVLCNPVNEDCDEFIELFFPGPGLIDMTHFAITDNDAVDELTAETTPFLTPGNYAVILDPEYENGDKPYNIPDGTVILHPANSTIGDGLAPSDPVLLLFDSLTVSSYGTPDNPLDTIPFDPGTGLSVERITPAHPDLEKNWISSPAGPTPGALPCGITNGVDYSVVSTALSPPMGAKTTETTINIRLSCIGTETVSQGDLRIRISADGEEFHSFLPAIPDLGKTVTVKADWHGTTDATTVTAELICSRDTNSLNNRAETIWNPEPGVCINEIFYHDIEWIELFNGTEYSVSLGDYTISDPTGSSPLPPEQLAPGDLMILTESIDDFRTAWAGVSCAVLEIENWRSLNNSADSLMLADRSQTIDMVPYCSEWGGNAAGSLERRSPSVMGFIRDNWATSIAGATPGAVNSIGSLSSNDFLHLTPAIFNPPHTPLRIEVNLPMQACDVTVKVFDVRGMELKKLYSSVAPGRILVLEWMGNEHPVGRYIIFAEASCAGEKLSDAQVVVLARPL